LEPVPASSVYRRNQFHFIGLKPKTEPIGSNRFQTSFKPVPNQFQTGSSSFSPSGQKFTRDFTKNETRQQEMFVPTDQCVSKVQPALRTNQSLNSSWIKAVPNVGNCFSGNRKPTFRRN